MIGRVTNRITIDQLYKFGVDKFANYLEAMYNNLDVTKIIIDGTKVEYCTTLIKMYAETDGEYFKFSGTYEFNEKSKIYYLGILSRIQSPDKIDKYKYKILPGSISKENHINDRVLQLTFTKSNDVYYLLLGKEFEDRYQVVKTKNYFGYRGGDTPIIKIPHITKVHYATHSETSNQSKQALLADGLSDEGFNILLNKLMQEMLKDNSGLMTKLVNKTLDAQYKKNLQYKYKPYDTENKIKNPTLDIYNPSVLRKSISILKQDHKLLIVGESGSGKSRLATLLAQKLTNKIIDSESSDGRYQHIWIKNVDGEMLWYTGQDSTIFGNLNIFINHINNEIKRDPNNIDQNYVFILNEIQRTDIGAISGNLFESWSSGTLPGDIPSNLYIICTACSNSDFELDEQIFQRFGHVELDYLRKENEELRSKLLINIAANHESDSNRCSDIIAKCQELNDAEEYQVINMRYLFAMINGGKIRNHINEQDLTIQGQKILKELIDKGYYDY